MTKYDRSVNKELYLLVLAKEIYDSALASEAIVTKRNSRATSRDLGSIQKVGGGAYVFRGTLINLNWQLFKAAKCYFA